MKNYILLLITMAVSACGFNSSEISDAAPDSGVSQLRASNDIDGDLVKNEDELKEGRNPFIADIPELRVRFLQNYKIVGKVLNIESQEIEEFVIDTKVGRDNPDFKYRVGEVFIREQALKEGAKVAQFSNHSHGQILKENLTRVKYPDIDESFYLKQVMNYKKYFNTEKYEVQTIDLYLESTAKLKENGLFDSVNNFSANFYYFNYEKESYELLASQTIERHFNKGVNEVFEVKIENVPASLIEDNYFKRGEFIISEVNDYEIPELKTSHNKLSASVKSKTLPVIYNTPLDSKIYHIAVSSKKMKLNNILETIFDKNFEISNNQVKRVGQFENNLPEFSYLNEIVSENKKGKWFIFTNGINKHYLDYEFGNEDLLSLSYIMGSELSNQISEKIFNFSDSISTTDSFNIVSLGNITPNSEVNFQLSGNRVWGEKLKHWSDTIRANGGGGQNRLGAYFICNLKFNIFSKLDENFKFKKDLTGEFERISLLINQNEYNLKKLIADKKVIISWAGDTVHLNIRSISQIEEISDVEENVISLKFNALTGTTYEGVLLESMQGRDSYMCPGVATNIAGSNKWPLSSHSQHFGQWARHVDWNRVKKGGSKTYQQLFSVSLSSIINNLYN